MRLDGGVFANGGAEIKALDGSVVELGGSAVVAGGTFTGEGTGVFRVPNGDTGILKGEITNNTTIAVSSTGSNTNLKIDGPTTLTGTGKVSMSNMAQNRIYGVASTDVLTNAAQHTIEGAGQLGVNLMGVINDGLIQATEANKNLVIDPSDVDVDGLGSDFLNNNVLQADGGTLCLEGGVFANTGAEIRALDGSVVELGGSAVVAGGTFTGTGTGVFRVPNGDTGILNGEITNNTTIEVSSTGSTTNLKIDGSTTLIGTGKVSMSNMALNRIYGVVPTDVLTNAAQHTIEGAGQLGVNLMGVINDGLIQATEVNKKLVIDPSDVDVDGLGSDFGNNSVIQANGGTLRLQGGVFANTGAEIKALDGSVVELGGSAVVAGGTFTGAGTGVFRVPDSDTGILNGEITNNTTIEVSSTGSTTNLRIDGPTTLTGTGKVSMSHASKDRISGVASTDVLTNAAQHTIEGAGQLGYNLMGLVNQGTIEANRTTQLTIDPDNTVGFTNTNEGDLLATGLAGLALAGGPFTTSGTVFVAAGSSLTRTGDFVQTGGTTTVEGTLTDNGGTMDIQGGVLTGNGLINGHVVNAGAVRPGSSPGTLDIVGSYAQTGAGELDIEIGGYTADTDHDQINVTGSATVAGTLDINLINSFSPNLCDTFLVFTATDGTGGRFDVIDDVDAPLGLSPAGVQMEWLVDHGTFGEVELLVGIHGDVNCDGAVNGLDVGPFVDVVVNGPYDVKADMNDDGGVNGLDVDPFVWAVLTGGAGAAGSAAAVPEPSTLALLALGVLVVLSGVRRRLM